MIYVVLLQLSIAQYKMNYRWNSLVLVKAPPYLLAFPTVRCLSSPITLTLSIEMRQRKFFRILLIFFLDRINLDTVIININSI